VTFTEASGDLERIVAMGGSNCCVRFRGKTDAGGEERRRQKFTILVLLIISLMVVGIVAASKRCNGNGCVVDAEHH